MQSTSWCDDSVDAQEAVMMMRNFLLLCAVGLAIAPAVAQPAAPPRQQCYFVSELGNWRAPDMRTINFRVRSGKVIRLGLGNACYPLRSPTARLITDFRSSNTVCSPLDWNLRASDGIGSPAVPCIVKTMTELSPAEIAALPAKAKP
jgi:hypothetical protein